MQNFYNGRWPGNKADGQNNNQWTNAISAHTPPQHWTLTDATATKNGTTFNQNRRPAGLSSSRIISLPSAMAIFDVIPVLKSARDTCIQNGLCGRNDVCMPDDTYCCSHLHITQRRINLVHLYSGSYCVTGIIKAKNYLAHPLALFWIWVPNRPCNAVPGASRWYQPVNNWYRQLLFHPTLLRNECYRLTVPRAHSRIHCIARSVVYACLFTTSGSVVCWSSHTASKET